MDRETTEKNSWGKPNDASFALKIIDNKFIASFTNEGEIKFGTPKEWAEYKTNKAVGDRYEGLVAFCHMADIDKIQEFYKTYPPEEGYVRSIIDNRLIIKRANSIEVPCFCMYAIYMDSFNVPDKSGFQSVETSISQTFFTEFVGEINQKDKDCGKSLVFITNLNKFIKRIKLALIKFGFAKNEIDIVRIKYEDYEQYGNCGFVEIDDNPPREIIHKSKLYAYQSECRIMVSSKNKNLVNKLLNENLIVGSLSDVISSRQIKSDDIFKLVLEGEFRETDDQL